MQVVLIKRRGLNGYLLHGIIFLFILANNSFGQVSRSVFFHENLPSSNVLNAANRPPCKFYFNLPVISTFYIGFESPFSFNQLTSEYPSGDSLFIDREAVIEALKRKNYFSFELYNELGRAGFGTGRHYFHLSIAKVFSTKFAFDRDLIALVLYGNANENFIGRKLSFSKTGLNMTSYHEFALGYSFQVNNKFSVGTRLKYLNGAFNVWTEKAEFTLFTDAEPNFALTASSDIVLHTSSTISDFDNLIDQVEGYKWFDLTGNHGYGFDLGVTYEPSKLIKLSASVTDIGWIGWNDHVKNFKSANPGEEYVFDGFDIDDFIHENKFSDTINFTDTLTNHFRLLEDHNAYNSHLSPKVYLGGLLKLNTKNEFGLMVRTDFVEQRIQPSLTLNYTHHFGNFITVFGNYSFLSRSLANIGAGIIFKTGPVQLYGMTDIFYGFVVPAQSPNYNFQVGMNFLFGHPGKSSFQGIPKKQSEPEEESE